MPDDGAVTEKEKSLLAGCIRGDKASWDAFVSQYSPLVYHTIRKTFVTYHAELNSDLKTTRRYLHADDEQMKKTVERIGK